MSELKYLAIGDIFMDGPELPEGAPAWPKALVDELRAEGYDLGDPVSVVGRTKTAGQLLYDLKGRGLPTDFNLVTIQLGAWDLAKRTPHTLFSIAVTDILAEAIRRASGDGSRVVLVTPPLFGDVADDAYLERFAEMVRLQFAAVVERREPHFVDTVETSIELLFGDEPDVTENGFPGARAHLTWARQVAQPARHILGPPRNHNIVDFPTRHDDERS